MKSTYWMFQATVAAAVAMAFRAGQAKAALTDNKDPRYTINYFLSGMAFVVGCFLLRDRHVEQHAEVFRLALFIAAAAAATTTLIVVEQLWTRALNRANEKREAQDTVKKTLSEIFDAKKVSLVYDPNTDQWHTYHCGYHVTADPNWHTALMYADAILSPSPYQYLCGHSAALGILREPTTLANAEITGCSEQSCPHFWERQAREKDRYRAIKVWARRPEHGPK